MLKKIFLILLSLIFWLQFCVVVYLGAKLLFFNQPVETREKITTPAEIRNKI